MERMVKHLLDQIMDTQQDETVSNVENQHCDHFGMMNMHCPSEFNSGPSQGE
jgi:hypothetical protein